MKKMLFDDDAKAKILEGSRLVTKAVAATLGPRGNNVMYGRDWGIPGVVHDGVTVAKEVGDSDPFVQDVIETITDAAERTDSATGDGTTTAVVLTDAILTEGIRLTAAGHNPMMLRRGIEPAVEALVAELKRMAKPVQSDEEINQVAYISAQNKEIGEVISRAIKKLGRDAVITVEESNAPYITVDYKDGMEFDQGYLSPYFQTDPELGEAVVSDARILITDKILGDLTEFVPFLQNCEKAGIKNNIVVIAPDVQGQVLATLIMNKVQNNLSILAVKAPSFGDKQRDVLEDIAALTGGQLVSADTAAKLQEVDVETVLGTARRVVATKDNTTIVDGAGDEAQIAQRVQSIKNRMEKANLGEFDQETLQERLAKLTSGIAVINVGAPSEPEKKEKKERIIDAIAATRAALEEGIVPGGETALLRAAHVLEDVKATLTAEEAVGVDLVAKAIVQPFRRLMTNSGFDAGQMYARLQAWMDTEKIGDISNVGVDVMDGQVKNLVVAGVIDPVKVTRCALTNAASTATMLLVTSVLIVDEKPAE